MSSSPNSEMTPSRRHETKNFEKYEMKFRYGVTIDSVPKWDTEFRTDGETKVLEWVKTDKIETITSVEFAMIQDNDYCMDGKFINIYSTPDGPILAILLETTDTELVLLDPCLVQFEGRTNKLNFVPIFNVARKLRISKTAVRATQPPSELILAAYPGFLMNNRMALYQLKPAVPMAQTEALTNAAS